MSATANPDGMIPNTFMFPNILVDRLMPYLSAEEWKVLSFAVRQIYGWRKERIAGQASISLSVFMNGAVIGEWRNYGVGLSKPTLTKALQTLIEFGIIRVVDDKNSEGTIYALADSEHEIHWSKVHKRFDEQLAKGRQRTDKARSARRKQVVYETNGGFVGQTDSGLSDKPIVVYGTNLYKPNQINPNTISASADGEPTEPISGNEAMTDGVGKSEVENPTPKPVPTPSPHNELFEVVCMGSFGKKYADIGNAAGRVGKIVKALQGKVTPDELKAGYALYKASMTEGGKKLQPSQRLKSPDKILDWCQQAKDKRNKPSPQIVTASIYDIEVSYDD
jgi:hypothetical protein